MAAIAVTLLMFHRLLLPQLSYQVDLLETGDDYASKPAHDMILAGFLIHR